MRKGSIILIIIIYVLSLQELSAQNMFSIATDLSVLKNTKKDQRFLTAGQNILANFSYSKKNAAYVSVSYYSTGNFKNNLTAKAKNSSTNPQLIPFENQAAMKIKKVSVGFKHYLKGSIDAEEKWNLYGVAGFGLLIGIIENTYSVNIDSAKYLFPTNPIPGKGNFKRLTMDLGFGAEFPLGAGLFLYSEGKVWLPSSGYPSNYLFVNDRAPFIFTANFGIRVLFH